jgi:hypothetical protein
MKPKHASNDVSEIAEVISLNVQYIFFTLEENDLHRHSKPPDPNKASNPHRFRPLTSTPHRHHQKKEEDPHLHTGDNKSKA